MEDVREHSLKDAKWKNPVIERNGLVVDNQAKSLVTSMIPPNAQHFCVMDVAPFKEAMFTRGKLAVVVERRGSDKPEWRWVSQIDGRVLVLESPLNYTPQEGACVSRLLGVQTEFYSERALEEHEKKAGYVWT